MAATVTPTRDRLPAGAHTALRARRPAAEALPDPDEEWRQSEVADQLVDSLPMFRKHGIVDVVRTERVDGSPVNLYRTTEPAAAYVDTLDDPTAPCGHTGVRNVRDEDAYTCARDHCDVRFDRETAREVMGR